LQLAIYDRDVSLARLFGANKEYIEREIPHISQLMRGSIEEVINDSEVIVLGNKAKEFERILPSISNGHLVIDLVRVFDRGGSGSHYQGICW
jgi:GDP-mannose 6-dehydrogenase